MTLVELLYSILVFSTATGSVRAAHHCHWWVVVISGVLGFAMGIGSLLILKGLTNRVFRSITPDQSQPSRKQAWLGSGWVVIMALWVLASTILATVIMTLIIHTFNLT
ncbi:MAG: hypothetical protein JWO08_2332 [Verrucomicrobiaceae bacterium]|nr:hypothetical protein [Verrucomicrobiaceae bacterium]